MKKLLLFILLLGTTCEAATINRLQKDVSQSCTSLINTSHSRLDVVGCMYDKISDDNTWSKGWSQRITIPDNQTFLLGRKPIVQYVTLEEEQVLTYTMKPQLQRVLYAAIIELRKEPIKNLTFEEVQELKSK